MAIKLVIEALDDQSPVVHELDQSLITVGRSKSCHIELDHPEISRRHFIIKYVDQAYVLLDEKSRHGTKIDGKTLEPQKTYTLGFMHVIDVPGFSIKCFCDGQRPRLERTTVVARELLDDLLQGEIRPRECPSLRSEDFGYEFKFVEEKTTFILGTLLKADFVVNDPDVAKKHLSFARDIFGIRVIPIFGNAVTINGELIVEPQILSSGSVIKVGSLELCYSESDHLLEKGQVKVQEARKSANLATQSTHERPVDEIAKDSPAIAHFQQRSPWWALDRVFIFAFVAVAVGAIFMISNLI